jgi:D-alanyl-D-alanine carboxypeptidase
MRLFKFCATAALASTISGASVAGETLNEGPLLEAAVKATLQEFDIPGAAIGVWTPSGHWVATVGLADVASERPVKRRDHFAIRSITKSFTVTLLLQLVAGSNGAVGLDDVIAKHLPGIPNGEAITLRELANMTSGLYDYSSDPAFGEAFVADPARAWTTDELLAFAFDDRSHSPINFQPGEQYQYSNTNTLVLGKMIERLTGEKFEDLLRQEILLPLDLHSTVYLGGIKMPRPAVQGYQGETPDGQPKEIAVSFSALGFAGAMASTLQDLAGWGRALTEGSLLPPDLQRQRFEAHATSGDPTSPVYDAYGVGMGQIAGWWGHTGSGAGFEAAVLHQIERNETFVVLLNASNSHDVPARIFCRVLRVLNESPPPDSGSVCAPGNESAFSRGTDNPATD